MLTSQQVDAVARSPMPPARSGKEMLTCPVCGVAAIFKSDQRRMLLLQSIQCPACSASLRLKWARLITLVSLAALAPLVFEVYRIGHGATPPPAALYLPLCIGIILASQRLERLPLEPAR
jgi:hypothetical protein